MEPAIRVENLFKTYRLYKTPMDRIKERLPWNKKAGKTFHTPVHALQDINVDIMPGQCVGLIGGNGAGKSTLLKILNSTTFPTAGRYEVRGKVAALLELGAGFQAQASGRANIFLNAALMGRSQEEMKAKYRQILDFSELHDFIQNPLKTYSSGMKARLGFSVAVATDPDVLIIDEILSVGDKHFRKKCVDKIMGFKEQGKTMFFCSHSLYDVRQICEKVIWLRNGKIQMFDDAVTVTNEYATFENQLASDTEKIPHRVDISGELEPDRIDPEGQPRIISAHLVDPNTREPRHVFGPRDAVGVRVHVKNGNHAERLNMVVGFTRTDGTLTFAPATDMDGVKLEFDGEAFVTLILPDIRLLSGEFVVPVWLLDHRGVHRFHEKPTEVNLIVQNRNKELGLFYTDRRWEVEPVPSEEPAS